MSENNQEERSWLLNDEERQARPHEASSSTSSSSTLYGAFNDSRPLSPKPVRPTPIPWRALLILYLLNAAQPLAYELIFPFVNQMILEIGVVNDPTKVGFYSGLIESIFALASFCSIMPFSFVSDHYGRKPVILLGITGLSISVALFGLSKSFWFMVVTRSIAGIVGGIWSAMRIMIAELTDKSNQAVAFSGLVTAYRTGQVVAHPLGGWLAHPERRWALFRSPFWYAYPFSLPCFVAAILGLSAVVWGYFNLQETLPSKRKLRPLVRTDTETTVVSAESAAQDNVQMPRPTILQVCTPYVVSVIVSNLTMVLVAEILFAVYPLFAFTPIKNGGLGVSEAVIGTHTATRAFLIITFMFVFPMLERRVGCFGLYKITMFTWPFAILFFPLLNVMARLGWESTRLFRGTLLVFFFIWAFASLCWTTVSVMINDIAPSASAISTINSLSGMSISFAQAFSPWIGTSMFAFSIELNFARGGLIWIVMFTCAVVAAFHSPTLNPPLTDWRDDVKNSTTSWAVPSES